MTGEEMERAVAFVLEQQARFEVRLSEMGERFEARFTALADAQAKTDKSMGVMREALVATIATVHKLAEAQAGTDRRLDLLTERVDTLTERVDTMAGRLDAFIVVVERYITRNGSGNAPKPY